jgi:hypothetical protein
MIRLSGVACFYKVGLSNRCLRLIRKPAWRSGKHLLAIPLHAPCLVKLFPFGNFPRIGTPPSSDNAPKPKNKNNAKQTAVVSRFFLMRHKKKEKKCKFFYAALFT